jgi:hypothetical protein
MITVLLVAAALAWLFWPRGTATNPRNISPSTADLFHVPAPAAALAPPPAPDGRAAIDSLLAVRDRLAAAGPMDEESAKSIDRLWLDLLHTGAKR